MLRGRREQGARDECERPALHHLSGSGIRNRPLPDVRAVPRVPLRARPHLLELVRADAPSAAPKGCRLLTRSFGGAWTYRATSGAELAEALPDEDLVAVGLIPAAEAEALETADA